MTTIPVTAIPVSAPSASAVLNRVSRTATRAVAVLAFAGLAACVAAPEASVSEIAVAAVPSLAWQASPQTDRWTQATMTALQSQGAPLLDMVPEDIAAWCPGYATATDAERAAFWAGLLSALAEHESTWNPAAVGGGGRWFGLVQISPATARGYGCEARTGSALQDGAANLVCAVRIMASTVLRDGVVAANRGGLAADWGPFSNAGKRAEMAAWTRQQPFCQPAGEL